MPGDLERAKELIAQMMDEYSELYAARGEAFRVEFFTNESNGAMLMQIRAVEAETV